MTEVTMAQLATEATGLQVDTHQRHLRIIGKIKNYLGLISTGDTTAPVTTSTGPSLTQTITMAKPLSYWNFQQPAGTTVMPDLGSLAANLNLRGDRWDIDTPDYRNAYIALDKIAKATELSQGGWGYATGNYTFTGGLSFEAWISPQNWNWIQTMFAVFKSGSPVWRLEHVKDKGFQINDVQLADVTIDPAKLHHFAVTVSTTGAANLYWDGVKVGNTVTVAAPAAGDQVQIGKGTSGQLLGTAWTHVAVYDKELSAQAIADRWATGTGVSTQAHRGRYHVHTTDLATLFSGQTKAAFYANKTKFRFTTWWGGISTLAEAQAEKAAGSDAMIVITQWEDPANYTGSGLMAIPVVGSPKWSAGQQPTATFASSDAVAAWWTEDEMTLGLDDLNYGLGVLAADLDKADSRYPVSANHGYDLAYRPTGAVQSIINVAGTNTKRKMQIQGMDYYVHSTGPNIRKDMGQKLGFLPSGDATKDAQALSLNGKMRHSYISYEIVRYLRSLYDHDVMHQGFIALGHANSVGGGMPTGREVRGDAWASILAGAQTIAWFYHSFAEAPGFDTNRSYKNSERIIVVYGKDGSGNDRFWTPAVAATTVGKAPADGNAEWTSYPTPYFAWDASRTYAQDDTVARNGGYYTAVKAPTVGKAPENDLYVDSTDTGAWVKWQYQAQGLRAMNLSSAPGMQQWVLKVEAEANKLAQIIHSPAGDLALSDQKLVWRHWPNAARTVLAGDSAAYAWTAVMQGYDQWKGTYTAHVPDGVQSVDVFTDLTAAPTTVAVSNGTIPLTFNAEHEVRFLRWDPTNTTTVTAPQVQQDTPWTVAMIGDSMVAPAIDNNITPAMIEQKFIAAGATQAQVFGLDGKQIEIANNSSWTTTQKIRDIRASGFEPTMWTFMLGQNMGGMTVDQLAGEVDKVLAELDSIGRQVKVGWANWQSRYAIDNYWGWGQTNTDAVHFNDMIAAKMAARGANGHVIDVWTWLSNMSKPYDANHEATGPASLWYSAADKTHPTLEGANHKFDDFIVPDVRKSARGY